VLLYQIKGQKFNLQRAMGVDFNLWRIFSRVKTPTQGGPADSEKSPQRLLTVSGQFQLRLPGALVDRRSKLVVF